MNANTKLLILDGAPGSGKTAALRYIADHFDPRVACILPKFRTGGREPRPGEFTADYLRVTDAEFDALANDPEFFGYRFGTDRFGFRRSDIEAHLASTANTVLVARSTSFIRELKQVVTSATVVPVFLTAPVDIVRERVQHEHPPEVVARRLARRSEFERDFDPSVYATVIHNDRSLAEFEAAIHNLIDPMEVAA